MHYEVGASQERVCIMQTPTSNSIASFEHLKVIFGKVASAVFVKARCCRRYPSRGRALTRALVKLLLFANGMGVARHIQVAIDTVTVLQLNCWSSC